MGKVIDLAAVDSGNGSKTVTGKAAAIYRFLWRRLTILGRTNLSFIYFFTVPGVTESDYC